MHVGGDEQRGLRGLRLNLEPELGKGFPTASFFLIIIHSSWVFFFSSFKWNSPQENVNSHQSVLKITYLTVLTCLGGLFDTFF